MHRDRAGSRYSFEVDGCGAVALSIESSQRMAWARLFPHISSLGRSERHTAGLSGWPKILHLSSSPN
jgi:hypothetical protein